MIPDIRSAVRALLLGSVGLAALSGTAHAQAPQSGSAASATDDQNEIIVTANRREETVQDVPSAITAIGQQEIEARGIDSFEGFARSVPGLTMNQATRNRAAFNIRGIATSANGLGNTQDPVSVYVNDTPVTDTFGAVVQPDLRLFDVERIEVLRGPQGTLFGSGSLGGTIRIITNKPDASKFEAAGRVDLGVTAHGGGLRQRYDAMVNIPLIEDRLALRLVGYYRDEEGWVKNLALGTRNDTIDWGGRASLLWTPTDAFSVRAEIFHQDSDPEDGDSWNPTAGKFRRTGPIAEGRPLTLTNYNLAIDYDFENFATLTSSTTYQKSKTALFRSFGSLLGPGTPNFLLTSDPWLSKFFVQEVRLVSNTQSRLQWVLGGFYINRRTATPNYLLYAPGLNNFFGGALGSDTFLAADITPRSSELAAYADGSYEVIDGLKLRGGFRVFHTTADYIEKSRTQLNFATFSYVNSSLRNSSKGTNTTWRAGLSYEPNRDLLFFANVSKGFRVGQVNPNSGPSAIDPADYVIPSGYKPDSTINYEVGAKTSFLGGDVTLNLTGFYIDWTDIQIDGRRLSDSLAFIANAGKATVKGVEAEITARPARGVNLYATVTVQDGKIESLPTNIFVPAAVGDRLPGLAQWKLSGGIQYRWDVGGENQAYVRVDGQYTDAAANAFAAGGTNPLFAISSGYTSIDGSIGVDTSWGSVAIYGENLTDNDSIILRDPGNSGNPYLTLRPRTFGIRVSYKH
jgi:outer membrane receptor protein involved in Fe transport